MDLSRFLPLDDAAKSFESHERRLKDSYRHEGERPAYRPSRVELEFMLSLARLQALLPKTMESESKIKRAVQITIVPPSYQPCIQPLEKLKKMMMDELLIETHHRGAYLLLRTTTRPYRRTAIWTVVEDEKGDATLLLLYNQTKAGERAAEDVLPQNKILMVKEPYMSMTCTGDNGIRVDHVSDVIFLSEFDERVPVAWRVAGRVKPSANDLKREGNVLVGQSKYYEAVERYTTALDSSPAPEEAAILYLNRSFTFLKTDRFDAALTDLDRFDQVASSTINEKSKEKAQFRRAQALYGLGKFQESCDILKAASSAFPSNKEISALLRRSRNRLREQKSADYKFEHMHEEAKLRPPLLDHASYYGPVVIKSADSSNGLGLFTTKAVQAGDLLLCEKAFVFWSRQAVNAARQGKGQTPEFDIEKGAFNGAGVNDLVQITVDKLSKNPSLMPNVNDLYWGTDEPIEVLEVDGQALVDTFLTRRMILLNNVSTLASSQTQRDSLPDGVDSTMEDCSGVWLMCSHMNHSCMYNSFRSYIGDMMIVRAACDMPADTELTVYYQTVTPRGPDPHSFTSRNFRCQCAICEDRENTDPEVLNLRNKLGYEAENRLILLEEGIGNLAAVEQVMAAMNKTYSRPPTEVPRLGAWGLQLDMARKYGSQADKMVDAILQSLESLGFVIEGARLPYVRRRVMVIKRWGLVCAKVIGAWVLLEVIYDAMAPPMAVQAARYTKTCYRICNGEDDTFEETLEQLAAYRRLASRDGDNRG